MEKMVSKKELIERFKELLTEQNLSDIKLFFKYSEITVEERKIMFEQIWDYIKQEVEKNEKKKRFKRKINEIINTTINDEFDFKTEEERKIMFEKIWDNIKEEIETNYYKEV